MGASKRRKATLGTKYGDPNQEPFMKGLPLTKGQMSWIYRWTTRGAWTGIGVLAAYWIVIRLIGPVAGWWHLSD